ncbi:MAG: hypothetical protein ACUVTX_11170, partial [Bacteroidales bacterium]
MLKGPDSVKYKIIQENINSKTSEWIFLSFIAEQISEFNNMVKNITADSISFENLKSEEDNLYLKAMALETEFDSLWNN